jgi:hypothetical protein
MKRFVLGLVMVMALTGFAWGADEASSEIQFTFPIENNTASILTTFIDTDVIRPGTDKILGFTLDGGQTGEVWATVYDSTQANFSAEVIGELESTVGITNGIFWQRARKIVNGVAVQQGPYTKVVVYFTSQ